ncbi:MAG: hypothetical protein ACRC9L_05255 [Brevinema sp.]
MKKRYLFLAILSMIGVVISAQVSKNTYIVVDQIAGKKVRSPIWAERNLAMTDLEAINSEKYAFIVRRTGADLADLEIWVNKVSISDVVIRQISEHIIELAAKQSEDIRTIEFINLMRDLAQNISKASIQGLSREQEWWILKQYRNKERRGDKEYTYSALYLIDKTIIDDIIALHVDHILQGGSPELERNVLNVLESLPNHQLSAELDSFDIPESSF